ncbi:MAG: TlpA family protein disulfide reductase [Gemmatimonas sp.]|uniref:TlpA family protein disulfide reductase n=1 Tax=Gemmatimonas sp. TaxID=1962908 RepID=UPI00391F1014
MLSMRPRIDSYLALIVAALAVGCTPSRRGTESAATAPRDLTVSLSAVGDPSPAQGRGMSNLFYRPSAPAWRDSIRTPAGWTAIETDELISARQVTPIRVLRFRASGDTAWRFIVDTAGSLDFTRVPELSFVRQGKVQVASLNLTLRSASNVIRRVPFEVLRSDDGYTYGRIAEYRAGQIEIDGKIYGVRVRNTSRDRPLFDLDGSATVLVDLDGDGVLAERASVTVGGRPASAEQVRAGSAFELNGRLYELASIDPLGAFLRLRERSAKGAVGLNLPAPEVRARQFDGSEFRLSQQRGKVVLLSFWATDCGPSASVRPALNEAVSTYGSALVWAAMAKDTSRADIDAFLKKSPMAGVVLQPDETTWQNYDPDVATPVFAIIDAKGVLRFRATGALSIDAVRAKLRELLGR